jgi:hypothetical protein
MLENCSANALKVDFNPERLAISIVGNSLRLMNLSPFIYQKNSKETVYPDILCLHAKFAKRIFPMLRFSRAIFFFLHRTQKNIPFFYKTNVPTIFISRYTHDFFFNFSNMFLYIFSISASTCMSQTPPPYYNPLQYYCHSQGKNITHLLLPCYSNFGHLLRNLNYRVWLVAWALRAWQCCTDIWFMLFILFGCLYHITVYIGTVWENIHNTTSQNRIYQNTTSENQLAKIALILFSSENTTIS